MNVIIRFWDDEGNKLKTWYFTSLFPPKCNVKTLGSFNLSLTKIGCECSRIKKNIDQFEILWTCLFFRFLLLKIADHMILFSVCFFPVIIKNNAISCILVCRMLEYVASHVNLSKVCNGIGRSGSSRRNVVIDFLIFRGFYSKIWPLDASLKDVITNWFSQKICFYFIGYKNFQQSSSVCCKSS